MRRVSEIRAKRTSPRESTLTIALRTPDAAKALDWASRGLHLTAWSIGAAVLTVMAWGGAFGDTPHGFIHLTLAIAALFWATHTGLRVWTDHDRTTSERVTITLRADSLIIQSPARPSIRFDTRNQDIRFSSRPHWLGRQEERDERRVGHAIGYAFRDAWEVWCEAGLDVMLVAAVSHEEDARTIVRQLSEEYLFVTRGDSPETFTPKRTEPA